MKTRRKTMQIKLREYQTQDFEALEAIIRETWHYDDFSSPKTAIQLAKVFLSSCLTNYTFSRVAVVDELWQASYWSIRSPSTNVRFQTDCCKSSPYYPCTVQKRGGTLQKSLAASMGSISNYETKQTGPIRQNWPCSLSVLRAEETGSEKCFFDPRWTICGKKN